MISFKQFKHADTRKIAELLHKHNSGVCVFPINGTRRWYKLEHPQLYTQGSPSQFLETVWRAHIRVYKLLFDHGIKTLLSPITGPDILARNASYQQLIEPGLRWLCEASEMLDFYQQYNIRVRFYGDIETCFGQTSFAHLMDMFATLQQQTAVNSGPLLLFGICAHDATETVAKIGHTFHLAHSRYPTKAEIIKAYYGEVIKPVDFFIGFDRLAVFDMPLIATGQEDLYFTVAPSLYMDKDLLRAILYDHLYGRSITETYNTNTPSESFMRQFYEVNRHNVIGIGRRSEDGSFWYPLPQVEIPVVT